MRLPRDLSGHDLATALKKLGYAVDHQTGSHIRLTTAIQGRHRITVPAHQELRPGTLASILRDVAQHHGLTRDQLLDELFGK